MRLLLSVLLITFGLSFHASADEALSLTPQETYDLAQTQGDQMLFIDVRDPVEIMFVGFTDVADKNIPFMLADRSKFLTDKNLFAMKPHPDFAASLEQALKDKGLNKDALI